MATIDDMDLSRAAWRKSTHSNNGGDCVEVTGPGPAVAVRDSKDPAGPALAFTPAQWHIFTAKLTDGSRLVRRPAGSLAKEAAPHAFRDQDEA
jgi:Domain of unknown function (DUF397)